AKHGRSVAHAWEQGMKRHASLLFFAIASLLLTSRFGNCQPHTNAPLLPGVKAVWESAHAYREITPTREHLCINGLWRWQPARDARDSVPTGEWGYFKVPGCWPGVTDYMQKDCQTVYPHASWKDVNLGRITSAWYQREITIPKTWDGRKIFLDAEYINSYTV